MKWNLKEIECFFLNDSWNWMKPFKWRKKTIHCGWFYFSILGYQRNSMQGEKLERRRSLTKGRRFFSYAGKIMNLNGEPCVNLQNLLPSKCLFIFRCSMKTQELRWTKGFQRSFSKVPWFHPNFFENLHFQKQNITTDQKFHDAIFYGLS